VFDPSEPIRAARVVSVRDLARAPGEVIDDVEWNGGLVVLSRRGRMAAILAPLPERTIVEIVGPERDDPRPLGSSTAGEPEPPDPEWLALPSIKRDILTSALGNHPMPFSLNDLAARHGVRDTSVNVSQLELDGYVERGRRGNRLTGRGVDAARWLAREQAAASS
jgi:antitoxin (DNA-binding transcriptional repressor) of toxin-antitoxin stability system